MIYVHLRLHQEVSIVVKYYVDEKFFSTFLPYYVYSIVLSDLLFFFSSFFPPAPFLTMKCGDAKRSTSKYVGRKAVGRITA